MRALVVALTAVLTASAAAEPHWEFGTTVVGGQSTELVLRDGTYNDPVSRLVWPQPVAPAVEASLVLPWTDWTQTTVGTRVIVSPFEGTMVDEDWNAPLSPGLLVYGHSEHTARVTSSGSVWADQGLTWGPVTLAVGGLVRWTTWEAWDGWGHYEYDTPPDDDVWFYGPLIAYRQTWLIPYFGLSASWVTEAGTWTPSVRLGPYAWCFDRDDHNYAQNVSPKTAPLTFLDTTRGGVYGKLALEGGWPAGTTTWGLRLGAEGTWGTVGETTYTFPLETASPASITWSTDTAAAGAWYWEASLTVFMRN